MKIDTLTIRNFKNYFGFNRFDLTVSKEERIVLIGGENGSGKTTIQEAVRLCLFGKSMDDARMTEKEYSSYISSCLNKHAKATGENQISIILELTMDDDYPQFNLKISRNFIIDDGKPVREYLELTQSDQEVEMIDVEFWEDYIKSIIPPAASKYFFFDGEKVKDIVSSNNADDYIKEAVESISGLNVLRHLKNDIVVIKKRNIKAQLSSSEKEEIETLESELKFNQKSLERHKREISEIVESLKELKKRKLDIEDEMRRKTGIRDEEIRYLQKTITETETEVKELKSELNEFYRDVLPFAICRKQLEMLQKSVESEKRLMVLKEAHGLLNKEIELKRNLIEKDIEALAFGRIDVESLLELVLKHLIPESTDEDLKNIQYLSEEQMLGLQNKFEEVMGARAFKEKVKKLDLIQGRLQKNKRKQKGIINNDINGEYSKSIDDIVSKITRLEVRIEEMSTEEETISQNIKIIEDKILDIEKDKVLETFYQEKNLLLDNLITNIDHRIESNVSRCIELLENRINSIYRKIMHKEDMVEKIIFSEQGFKLRLIGFDGAEVDRKKLSEGEKGLLALSVQYGLSQISERRLPIIVDSPLGRMDSFHVNKILTEFYPNAGDQVIILSHDREITPELRGMMSDKIASTYLLSLSDKNKISKGYFTEATS